MLILEALRKDSLLFPNFIGCLHALACGPSSHHQSQQRSIFKPFSNLGLCYLPLWLPCLSLSFIRTLEIHWAHLGEHPRLRSSPSSHLHQVRKCIHSFQDSIWASFGTIMLPSMVTNFILWKDTLRPWKFLLLSLLPPISFSILWCFLPD